jgi:cytochrome c5
MSQQHASHDGHEGPIKTPKQLAWTVGLSFVVPVVVIILLAYAVSSQFKPAAGSDGMEEQRVAERLRPVAQVEVKDASDSASLKTGEQVFAAQCAACHATGAAGAPKLGDAAAWGGRIGAGARGPAGVGAEGQGCHGRPGRRRFLRLRDQPRRGLHGQPGWRQIRRTQGAGGARIRRAMRP